MRFEDYAREASRALAASGRSVDVPVVAEMWARRRRRGLVLGSTAVGVLVIGVVAAVATWGGLAGGEGEVAVPANTVPVDGGGVLFGPPRLEGIDTVEFPITLLDGTGLTLTLPRSLADEVEGLVPGGAASWQLDPCCSRSLEVIYGSVGDLYGERQPDVAYEDADGNPVGFFSEENDVDNLVFEYGSWVVRAWDGDAGGQRFTDENREMFASLMRGHETAEGFLVLGPVDPMSIGPSDSPDATLTTGTGEGLVGVFKWRDCASEGPSADPDVVTSAGHLVTFADSSGMTSICFPDSSLYLWVSRLDLSDAELEAIDLAYSNQPDPETPTTTSTTPSTTTPTTLPEAQPTLPGNTLQQSWDDGLVFSESMPWALAFDNGTCCIKTVTLDGDGSHLVSIGTQGGDQPFRLTLHDGRLVVSWGDIYAYDIATGTSTLLAEATFHVPASDPSNVWMIGYPGPRISAASPDVWEVDVTTGQATEPKLLESDGFVARGIPGGLALDSDDGIQLWDYETGEVVDSFGEGLSIVSDVTEDGRIAWCSEPCFEIVVTSLADGEQTVYARPEDELHPYGIGAARFSADGRYLAAPAGNDVMLIDTATGDIRPTMTFPDQTAPHLYVAWAPNNADLFAADYSYGAAESVIGHYSLVDDTAEVTTLPHGGTLSFVVLPSSETGSLVP